MNVKIETHEGGDTSPVLQVVGSHHAPYDGTIVNVTGGRDIVCATVAIRTPHQARELAQQLSGAATAYTDWAEKQERAACTHSN